MLGTCAGAILVERFGFLDAVVERNAYGPQIESRIVPLDLGSLGTDFSGDTAVHRYFLEEVRT